MLDTLNAHREESPQGILEGVQQSVNDFVGDAPQFDDLTMLYLEFKGNA
jgi:sigma-B regulation protein RsbU (phosphoserine phosphatase)